MLAKLKGGSMTRLLTSRPASLVGLRQGSYKSTFYLFRRYKLVDGFLHELALFASEALVAAEDHAAAHHLVSVFV